MSREMCEVTDPQPRFSSAVVGMEESGEGGLQGRGKRLGGNTRVLQETGRTRFGAVGRSRWGNRKRTFWGGKRRRIVKRKYNFSSNIMGSKENV